MPIRTIFLGSPTFAEPSLHALASDPRFVVALVVTQPDRRAGRGRATTPPAVKSAADALGLPTFQPDDLQGQDAVSTLNAVAPDLLVVVAYGELLGRHVLQLAPFGAINVHPSLLPRYRGATPIPAAILNGDPTTGVSIIKLVRRLDAGPILAAQELDITHADTAGTLSARLATLAATMLPDVGSAWVDGRITPREQDEAQATMTREWVSADARIDWTASATSIERLVRAANPSPGAWTTLSEQRVGIHAARLHATSAAAAIGSIVAIDGAPVVATGSGSLELLQVQPAGKRSMPAADWWRGLRTSALIFQ